MKGCGGTGIYPITVGTICTFTITESGKRMRVAKGCVYPRFNYVKGGKVVASSIVVGFLELLSDGMENLSDKRHKKTEENVLKLFLSKLSLLLRVKILGGDFERISTAVLVH